MRFRIRLRLISTLYWYRTAASRTVRLSWTFRKGHVTGILMFHARLRCCTNCGNYRKTKYHDHTTLTDLTEQMLFENRQLTKIDEVRRRMKSQRELIIFEHVVWLRIRKISGKISNFSNFTCFFWYHFFRKKKSLRRINQYFAHNKVTLSS